jgi:type IV secretory pathway protease TraF
MLGVAAAAAVHVMLSACSFAASSVALHCAAWNTVLSSALCTWKTTQCAIPAPVHLEAIGVTLTFSSYPATHSLPLKHCTLSCLLPAGLT